MTIQTETTVSLEVARNKILENASSYYDFGENLQVDGFSGWEYSTPGREFTRPVFLAVVDEDGNYQTDKHGNSITSKVYLTVVFKTNDSAVVEDIYAITENGNLIGEMNHAE